MAIKMKPKGSEEATVYGNENFGIPKDCTKKQRFSTFKLIFYIVCVAFICVMGYSYYSDAVDRFLPEITYDRTNEPLIYNTTSGLILKTRSGLSHDVAEIASTHQNTPVVSSALSGEMVFYLSHNEKDIQNLYYYKLETKETKMIDDGVSDFKVDENGKYVLYRKGDTLCFSNLSDHYSIASDVSEYYLSKNSQQIIFFRENGTKMYLCPTARETVPEIVDTNITKVISDKTDYKNIYYIKDGALYFKKYKTPKSIISTDVYDAIMLGETVYYTSPDDYEFEYSRYITDETSDEDKELLPPDGADFIRDIDGINVFDEEAFLASFDAYKEKLLRDEIRQNLTELSASREGVTLKSFSEGVSRVVDIDLVSPYLSYNSCKNILLYKKYEDALLERKDLSEFTSTDEMNAYIESASGIFPEVDMYLVKEGKKPFCAFKEPPTMQIEISLDGKFLYCINNLNDANNKLTRYNITSSALRDARTLAEGVTNFALDGSDPYAVIVFSDDKISLYYEDNLKELSESSYHDFFFVDKTLFYYDDYNYVTQSGTLCSVRNGKINVIDTDVYDFNVRKYNTVSYIKGYDSETGGGTLYIKEGKRVKRQSGRVDAIIN